MKTYYYYKFTDDVVQSANQAFTLPDNYQILPRTWGARVWNPIVRLFAKTFGWFYTHLYLHAHLIGREKLKQVRSSYFVYGNHTQPMGDVFNPITIFPVKNFYVIASQANWGTPLLGRLLVRYGALPVGHSLQQNLHLLQAIKTIVQRPKGVIVIYPEAHVWPYYTKIRPFPNTSFHFPVQFNLPSFTITTTYQKPHWGKRPRCFIYIDGPFYPVKTLPKKTAQLKLAATIKKVMSQRAQISNYSYKNYQQVKKK